MQDNAGQCRTIQDKLYNAVQYYTMQYIAVQCSTFTEYIAVQCMRDIVGICWKMQENTGKRRKILNNEVK